MNAVLHATCVAFDGRGVLILGPSGSGKSALGLHLMALGARLVADDRTQVEVAEGLFATAPPGLPPLIEARGVGLLRADPLPRARLVLAVDLGARETERLPPRREWMHKGHALPLVHGPMTGHFPAAIRLYILSGRQD
ncbi:HPr kinase/phosphorylase [Ruixingdingia sedimenti]|uniref:Serine kinase n=1 Tax=Ruixingdingia sedimenti TaxID=3073604 RepID=A0ABU1F8F0_9RHOB|nr:serine kinase [Xinfangfangia sp. LG-4]MDR5653136.1 serine kinase [Xinfangfangia sp. LG-4]